MMERVSELIRNEEEDGSYDHILLGYGGALLWLVSGEVRGTIYLFSILSVCFPNWAPGDIREKFTKIVFGENLRKY